jgi:NAD(P)-dependent dehydrogenase (short-subunit alcohol dehydrogenase family)
VKVFLVGVGGGIGWSILKALDSLGVETVTLSRTKKLPELGHNTHISSDIINVNFWKRILDQHIEDITHVVYCSGVISPQKSFLKLSDKELRRSFEVNFFGLLEVARNTIPYMRNGHNSKFIYLGTGAAIRGYKGWSAYCTSKAASHMFIECASLDHGDIGVKFIDINPGSVDTDMQLKIREAKVNRVSKKMISEHNSPEFVAEFIYKILFLENNSIEDLYISINNEEMVRKYFNG